ncbi:MAG: spore germination protein [Bacteroidota bacterium]
MNRSGFWYSWLRFIHRTFRRARIPIALTVGAAGAASPRGIGSHSLCRQDRGDTGRGRARTRPPSPGQPTPPSKQAGQTGQTGQTGHTNQTGRIGQTGRSDRRSLSGRTNRSAIPLLGQVANILGNPEDLLVRTLHLSSQCIAIVSIDGLVKRSEVSKAIVMPLATLLGGKGKGNPPTRVSLIEVKNLIVATTDVRVSSDPDVIIRVLLDGGTVILSDAWDQALLAATRGWETRRISEPQTESVVRGPRDGFTENLRTNTAMLRQRLRTPKLVFERVRIGTETNTRVVVVWLRDIVNRDVLTEVKQRLARVEIDSVLMSGYLEEWLEDNPFSPFPQLVYTERPDVVTASLLEGRVAIMTDGTPITLIVPVALTHMLQAPEDYYHEPWLASLTRGIRYLSTLVALLLPAVYVALLAFHADLIPTPLLLSFIRQRQEIPYPAMVEAAILGCILLTLLEANVRMPRPVGAAITILGSVVIGRAAVESSLISAAMVIVSATTILATLTIPTYNLSLTIRWLALAMLIPASILGLVGILFAVLAILIHLSGLRSFGLPYLSPYSPLMWAEEEDMVFRTPWWQHVRRPALTVKGDVRRTEREGRTGAGLWTPPQQPPPKGGQRLELERLGHRR